MARRTLLTPAAEWVEIRSTPADWKKADPALLGTMLTQLHLVRAFEEVVLELAGEGLVHGPAHSSIGQEGGAVGSIVGLRTTDQVNGSHRGHHQFLAKALRYVTPELDPRAMFPDALRAMMHASLAEILGLEPGFGHGRGGSMHLRWAEAGAIGTNAIVGGGAPLAAGAAMAMQRAGTGDVAVSYFGDGAINIGSVLETMNLASAWNLPLIFFCENNLYAVATHIAEVSRETRLSARGLGFGMPCFRVDGMDPLAVHLAMNEATAVARAGGGRCSSKRRFTAFSTRTARCPVPPSAIAPRKRKPNGVRAIRSPVSGTKWSR